MNGIYGWLVYNGGLVSGKFMEINNRYKESASGKGIALDLLKNNEIYSLLQNSAPAIKTKTGRISAETRPDFVLFLDKDIRLAKHLERLGYRLFNSADAIEACDDKILTYQLLAGHDVKIPKTLISPMMFAGTHESSDEFIDFVEEEFGYPVVVKEAFGSFGAQVYLVENREQLLEKRQELLYIPHLYQEFIGSSRGKDVRLHVVGGKVVASMMRTSETDFRANISNGGSMHAYEPPEEFKQAAIKASKLVGADFSGVDILFGENGEPIICEVNSNAHIKNIYDCTGVNVADHIFDYIISSIRIL